MPPSAGPTELLLYGLNFWPELTGVGKYSGELVHWLAARGHRVTVVTAPPYYPHWKVQAPYAAGRYATETWGPGERVRIIRCPLWVPRRVRTAGRLVHLASFCLSSLFPLIKALRAKPDAMVLVAPTLLSAPFAAWAARRAGVPSWLHVQDFEVDAMFGMGLGGRSAPLQRLALRMEARVLQAFDRASSISPPMVDRLRSKGVPAAATRALPNWVDLQAVYPMSGINPYRAAWGLGAADIVVLYAGNMGEKQGLEIVVAAASLLKDRPDIRFVLAGNGAAFPRLKAEADELTNMVWLPLQPVERLNELLNAADIHVLPQRADAADLVMPSKLTGMLASGRAVIGTAAAETQLGRVLDAVGCRVQPGNAADLADAIRRLAEDPGLRTALGERGRRHAEQHLGLDAIMQCFERDLLALCRSPAASPVSTADSPVP